MVVISVASGNVASALANRPRRRVDHDAAAVLRAQGREERLGQVDPGPLRIRRTRAELVAVLGHDGGVETGGEVALAGGVAASRHAEDDPGLREEVEAGERRVRRGRSRGGASGTGAEAVATTAALVPAGAAEASVGPGTEEACDASGARAHPSASIAVIHAAAPLAPPTPRFIERSPRARAGPERSVRRNAGGDDGQTDERFARAAVSEGQNIPEHPAIHQDEESGHPGVAGHAEGALRRRPPDAKNDDAATVSVEKATMANMVKRTSWSKRPLSRRTTEMMP